MTNGAKYVYGFSADCFMSGEYDTPWEALAAAQKEVRESQSQETYSKVYIGIAGKRWKPEIDGERIIDMLQEDAYDFGGDFADNHYLQGVTTEEINELTNILTKAFCAWAAKHRYEPDFYPVENVKEYELKVD